MKKSVQIVLTVTVLAANKLADCDTSSENSEPPRPNPSSHKINGFHSRVKSPDPLNESEENLVKNDQEESTHYSLNGHRHSFLPNQPPTNDHSVSNSEETFRKGFGRTGHSSSKG